MKKGLFFFLILLGQFLGLSLLFAERLEFPLYAGTIGGGEWDIYLSLKAKPLKEEELFEVPCVRRPTEKKKEKLLKELATLEREYEKVAREMGSKLDLERARKLYFESLRYEETCEVNCKSREVIVNLPGGNMLLRVSVLIPEEKKEALFNTLCKSEGK